MGRSGVGPVIRMSTSGTHGAGGVECCCCRCCTCIHVEFLKTLPGMVKVCETVSYNSDRQIIVDFNKTSMLIGQVTLTRIVLKREFVADN